MMDTLKKPLGEVISLKSGKSIKPGGEGSFPVYGSNGIIGYSNEYRSESAIIIGRVGAYCGSVEYCSGKFWASDNTLTAQPIDSTFDTKFIFYLLGATNLGNYAGGAAQPLVTQSVIRQILVSFPPLPEQKRIAGILSAYDDLIENNLRRIKILEQMAQSLYREWFVHFRYPGHQSIPLTDSPLGPIPQGWEVKKLGEIADIIPGYAFKSKDWCDEGIPVVKIKNIQGDYTVDSSTCDHVPLSIAKTKLEKYELKLGDLILAMTGATAGKTGRIRSKEKLYLNQRVARIAPTPDYEAFLTIHTLQKNFQDTLFNLADGAAQPNMSGGQIEALPIIIPPNNIVNPFTKFVTPLIEELDVLHIKNQTLRQTRDLLLPKLLSPS